MNYFLKKSLLDFLLGPQWNSDLSIPGFATKRGANDGRQLSDLEWENPTYQQTEGPGIRLVG
jgi:hypothetical protein